MVQQQQNYYKLTRKSMVQVVILFLYCFTLVTETAGHSLDKNIFKSYFLKGK